jgi:nondiscriminating aspartyl-tRNA synthetase
MVDTAKLQRTLTRHLAKHTSERVIVKGWVHAIRKFGAVNFLIVRDRTGMAQAIIEPDQVEKLDGLQVETVVAVEGIVAEEPRAAGGVELRDTRIEVVSPVVEVLPFEINKKVLKPSLDVFLNHAPVGLRFPRKQSVFRLYSALLAGFRSHLELRGFTEIHTPKIVGSATEGGANVFTIDYFGRPAFLAQSPQLYKQIMVGAFERVFEIGPAFRAETHSTVRHLNEYTSLDVELGFIESYRDVTNLLMELLQHMVESAVERFPDDVTSLGLTLPRFGEVPYLKLREAQQIIFERYGEDHREEPDLTPQDERWIGKWASDEHDTDFVMITHFPMAKRPFYTMPDPEDPGYSLGFDLVYKGQELVSGSQRIHDYDQLLGTMRHRGINPTPFEGYLEAFKYGMPPEGGFAIGSERLLMRLVDADNIRETTLFPRDVNRLTP